MNSDVPTVKSTTMTARPFRCLVADPPWAPDDQLPGATRGAAHNYRVLTQGEIEGFLVAQAERDPDFAVADNAILFLWRLSSMQREALSVAESWGFRVLSEVVWRKLTKEGKPWFGMGRTVRASHEAALICVRGQASKIVASNSVRSVFEAKVPLLPDGSYHHSAKPDEFFMQIVEPLIGGVERGGPCIELFARRRRPGWAAIGDQLPDE